MASTHRIDQLTVGAATPTVRRVEGRAFVEALDERWDDLVLAQARPNPSLGSVWLRRAAAIGSAVPLVVTAERGDRLVAAGAFELYAPAGRRGPRLARWLGYEADWLGPDLLVLDGDDDAGAAIVDAVLDRADALLLPVAAGSPGDRAIVRRVPGARREERMAEGWVAPLPAPREAYASSKVAADERRAARAGAHLARRVLREPDEVAAGLERLFDLHRARWSGRPDAILRFSNSEAQRAWHRDLACELAEHGWTLLTEIVEDGRTVAADLGFVAGRGALWHTPTHRPGGLLRHPGYAGLVHWLETARELGATSVDLGLGAGQPGGPKARVGAEALRVDRLLAGASAGKQRLVAGLLGLRHHLSRVR